MKSKFSDKYTIDELSEKVFPWACAICLVALIVYVVMGVADPWNFILVPFVVLGLLLVGCVFLMLACGMATGIAKLIYFLEGADE